MTKPITPDLVAGKKAERLPTQVIQVFNDLIVDNWDDAAKQARVQQRDAVDKIAVSLGLTHAQVLEKKYIDVERVYGKVGWCVEYNSVGLGDTNCSYFKFRPSKPIVSQTP